MSMISPLYPDVRVDEPALAEAGYSAFVRGQLLADRVTVAMAATELPTETIDLFYRAAREFTSYANVLATVRHWVTVVSADS